LLTTVQDYGRWGHQNLGVPVAGPMDAVSHRLANLLVGNQPDCATLEVTLVGPTLEFLSETTFAVAGAEFELWLDAEPIPTNTPRQVGRGSQVRFGRRGGGARAYLAVSGGFDVALVLGSRSTDLASGFGGLSGRPLRGGDVLRLGQGTGPRVTRAPAAATLTLPRGGATVRVLAGPDQGRFDRRAMDIFEQARFTLGPESNRMGYRLRWPSLDLVHTEPLLSSATPVGTIQVPPSGQPILLMADRQTSGGYAAIATVISADLPVAGQLAPGDWIAFEFSDRRAAVAALIAREQALMRCVPHDARPVSRQQADDSE
jgi:antagonist of KipI